MSNLTKFQYEKAKSCVVSVLLEANQLLYDYIFEMKEKLKDLNSKIWSLFQTVFIHLINGEKFYNNLLFLNQKSITKIGVFNLFKVFHHFKVEFKSKLKRINHMNRLILSWNK